MKAWFNPQRQLAGRPQHTASTYNVTDTQLEREGWTLVQAPDCESKYWVIEGTTITEMDQAAKDAVDAAEAQAEAARQAAKPEALKTAENALIHLLRRTGHIATNAVSIPPGTRAAVETNLIAIALDDPTGDAVNLIARFNGLFSIILSYGADPEQATWHVE